ncbi:hypothetical protein F7R25_03895 [Burkholderia stagnalis]|uniref:Uncharacterized protein n=1 Tax=Burkholderia stagnalis TaxID=1503054 RepID=A0A6L3N612_9BURK|nr:hypothetical protein [Burkholderia stagnalis]KAB0640647.1 hypothetical protein F7R25_03895 [Burkholderia stagnalis]
MSDFGDKLRGTISRLSQLPISNLRFLLESEFELLEHELRPLTEGVKVSFYKEVQSILEEAGHTGHSIESIRATYGRICRRKAPSPSEVPQIPITRTVDMTTGIGATSPKVSVATSVAQPRPNHAPGGASPVVEKITPDWKWREVSERLKNEPIDSLPTEQDLKIWAYLKQICDSKFPPLNIKTDYYSLEQNFNGSNTKDAVLRLHSKMIHHGYE